MSSSSHPMRRPIQPAQRAVVSAESFQSRTYKAVKGVIKFLYLFKLVKKHTALFMKCC